MRATPVIGINHQKLYRFKEIEKMTNEEYMEQLAEVRAELDRGAKQVAKEMSDKIRNRDYEWCYLCPSVIDTSEDKTGNLKPFLNGYVHHEYVCNRCVSSGRYKRNEMGGYK